MKRVNRATIIGTIFCLGTLCGPVFGQVRPEDRQYGPLYSGLGSQGAQPSPQSPDPTFFFEEKANWPALRRHIPGGEPRTAWEYAQRGIYRQDELAYASVDEEDRRRYMEQAIADYLQSEKLNHRILIVQARLGVIRYKEGRRLEEEGRHEEALGPLEEAKRRLEFVLEESPYHQGVPFLLGEVFEVEHEIYVALHAEEKAEKSLADALKYFKEELKLAPESQRTHYVLAELLLDEGEKDEAVAHLETYLCQSKLYGDPEPLRILEARRKRNELTGSAALDCAAACDHLYGKERCGS